MRYIESIAVYVIGVAAFMIFAAFAPQPSPTSFLIALGVLAALHIVVGYTIGAMSALGLTLFLPVFAGFVPTPGDGEAIPLSVAALVLGVPLAVVLMTLGVGIRELIGWRLHRIPPEAGNQP